jgi:glutathione S-transferase
MRTLYHFALSPFSRRVRLALALKGLEVTLKDGRADAANFEEAKKHWPLRAVPVLVEDGGRALGDSTAIVHYLDEAYATNDRPRLWPTAGEERRRALWTGQLVDGALNTLIDMATRYGDLRDHAAWPPIQDAMMAKVQGALDALGAEAATRGPRPVTELGWSAADIYLFTMTIWLETAPERAKNNENLTKIVSFPWKLPASLSRWADGFRDRADVLALGPAK